MFPRLLCLCLLVMAASLHARTPNIILIFADDLGYADIGCFGAQGIETPHLDRLAAEGRKFTRFYVSSPVCSASRAALLTGCYHVRVGIHGALPPNASSGLNPVETTLSSMLKARGYATAIVGKWHLGSRAPLLPSAHGFDEWLGLPYSNDMWPHHPEARPGTYPPLPLYDGGAIIDHEVSPQEQALLPERYARRAVDFIRRSTGGPFFLYFAPAMPHVPLFAGKNFEGKSKRGLYGDVISEIDWSVGEILSTLDELSIAGNTLIIFTSDNGPWLSYGEHAGDSGPLREGKGTCWEGGVRVPALMRWPGVIPAGTECREPLMTIDLLPTIAKLSDGRLPAHPIDGRDISAFLTGAPPASEHPYYFYNHGQLHALTAGRWKLMLPHTYRTLGDQPKAAGGKPGRYRQARISEPELYNLESDPSERLNVAADHPDVVKRFLALAERIRQELGSAPEVVGKGVRPAATLDTP